ncbi:MAG: hypothetical protein N3A58_04950 [Spirochaetes bacterium]|nr:hypothetical protein [Spirochaetota bacterium]
MSDSKIINEYLRDGNFREAYNLIDAIIKEENNFENIVVQHKIIKYWINRTDYINKIKDPYEKGLYLLKEWKNFCSYIDKCNVLKLVEFESVSYYVHKSALESFLKAREEGEFRDNNIDLLIKIYICYKELGNFDEAIKILKYTYSLNHDPQVLLYLADVYYLKGELNYSKLLFKELFFFENYYNLQLDDISCDKIFEIIDKIVKDKIPEHAVNYWIPVYGYIDGFFNLIREMKKEEIEKIKSNIVSLERYFYDDQKQNDIVKSFLIKNYIILIEYYIYQENDLNKVDQYFNKIKNIDSIIYDKIKAIFS